MTKNFEETVCLHSEKSGEWMGEVRGDRLHGAVHG